MLFFENTVYFFIKFCCDITVDCITKEVFCFFFNGAFWYFNVTFSIDVQSVCSAVINFNFSFWLLYWFKLIDDVNNNLWNMEDIADVLKEEIRHEATAHNFLWVNFSWYGQNFLSIKKNHLSRFVLTDNGEEIQ